MRIYLIHAGDAYGFHTEYLLRGPLVDLEALYAEFLLTDDGNGRWDFARTKRFIEWLKPRGFEMIDYILLCTEG